MGVMTGKIVEVNGREVQLVLQALDEEDLIKQVDAINEMERKAKDWDEILAIHNMDEKYEDTIGDYEQYIDKLVKKHLEDE